jgi:hypothetical protein
LVPRVEDDLISGIDNFLPLARFIFGRRLFRRPVSSRISPMAESFRRHLSKASCFRLVSRLIDSIEDNLPSTAGRTFQGELLRSEINQSVPQKIKPDTNHFQGLAANYAYDDQIDNRGVGFPIAFRKVVIYGAEAKSTFRLASLFGVLELFLYRRPGLVSG